MRNLLTALLILLVGPALPAQVFNRAPLEPTEYAALPLGAIRPEGWLREQLQRQADGLTGHLDEVYPQVVGDDNAWLGGDGDAWERGPYWIDGLLPLAYVLDDPSLKRKANRWVEAILASAAEDGYMGPATDHPFVYGLQRGSTHDWWPKMVALKIIQQHYMATGDPRVIPFLLNYFRYQQAHLSETPLDHWTDWGRWRGADNLGVIYWLYNLTGETWLLDLGVTVHRQTVDWTTLFHDGGIFLRPDNNLHCVNLGQGFKAPTVWWQYSHQVQDLEAPAKAVETIRRTVGLPTGLWAGDEQVHSGDPARGSELCTAVEMMFSLEEMLRITGDIRWADYLERVAYNALPTQVNDDYTAKQYFQQTNQVSCTLDWRPFSTPHNETDNVFGTLNGYPCCLCNMHQGWPKFTQNLWYATADGGLAALVYAPSEVKAQVAGVEVRIRETTDYPFREQVSFLVDFTARKVKKASFPLHFRVPGWCDSATVKVNGETVEAKVEEGIVRLEREWKRGDRIDLEFPMDIRTEPWYDQAWTFVRGPLVFALKLEEKWAWKAFEGADRYYGKGAWEVTTDSPWNYCVMRETFSPDACRVEYRDGGNYPWNLANAPVSLFIPARALPHWTHPNDIAYFTETGHDAVGDDLLIELVPYGCTTLRIAEFPTRLVPWDLEYRNAMTFDDP